MSVSYIEIAPLLLCDVCEGEIMTPDELAATTGCCRSCGLAYDFAVEELDEAVGR